MPPCLYGAFSTSPAAFKPGRGFFHALRPQGFFSLCAVSRCKALQGVLTPHLYSYYPAHFTRLCEPVRVPWAIVAHLSRFTLCCELAGDRRSGERDAAAYQAGLQAADASGRERQHIEGARRQSMDGIRQPSSRPGCEPGSGYRYPTLTETRIYWLAYTNCTPFPTG